jgi:hypothetical protein
MRWVIWIVGSLATIILLVAIVGAMLPQQHTASRTARIALAPAALYPMLVQMAQASTNPPVRLEQQQPPSLLVTRISDPKLPFGGTWTYRIESAGTGASDLTITENGEVYNVIFRFMSRFVLGHYATMDAFIRDLQARTTPR